MSANPFELAKTEMSGTVLFAVRRFFFLLLHRVSFSFGLLIKQHKLTAFRVSATAEMHLKDKMNKYTGRECCVHHVVGIILNLDPRSVKLGYLCAFIMWWQLLSPDLCPDSLQVVCVVLLALPFSSLVLKKLTLAYFWPTKSTAGHLKSKERLCFWQDKDARFKISTKCRWSL